MRCFTAIALPESIKERLVSISAKMPGNVTKVSKDNLHITPHFFGDISESSVPKITGILDIVQHEKFKISVCGLSSFGGSSIRAVYAKIADAGIKPNYTKEELAGKKVICIVNLDPKMIAGAKSNGMMLAAGDKAEEVSLLVPDKDSAEGARIH